MRECIRRLSAEDLKSSGSLAKLAYSNEVRGVRMFRCSTIRDQGWCIGGDCELNGGYRGVAPIGGLGREPQSMGSLSSSLSSTKDHTIHSNVLGLPTGFSKRFKRSGSASCP